MENKIKNQYKPDFISHPGETILELLEEKSLTQAELSRRMGRPKKTINEIVQGKAAITTETALQLERVLGVSSRFWLTRQRHYDESVTRLEERKKISKFKGWIDKFPIKSLIDLGWIEKREDEVDQVLELLNYFGVATPDQWEAITQRTAASFRLAKAYESNLAELAVWLRRGEILSQSIKCKPFELDGFLKLLKNDIRELTLELPNSFQSRLIDLCSSVGVAVAFVPQLPKARVSGATRWISPDKAVIQLSLRYKTDDHLWFTFYHEAGHIVLHGKRDIYIEAINNNVEKKEKEKEEEADRFAADILIPPEKLNDFLNSFPKDRFPPKSFIEDFAYELGISPGIVVGRLQHDQLPKENPVPYSHYNDLKNRLTWA